MNSVDRNRVLKIRCEGSCLINREEVKECSYRIQDYDRYRDDGLDGRSEHSV